ncbi:hypothetical protein AVDCRST_MAG94-3389, partial [uncultured Leptolyngbya sp.]
CSQNNWSWRCGSSCGWHNRCQRPVMWEPCWMRWKP